MYFMQAVLADIDNIKMTLITKWNSINLLCPMLTVGCLNLMFPYVETLFTKQTI